MQSEKQLVYDMLLEDLYDKIRRLEEDRHSVDITSGMSERFCSGVFGSGFWLSLITLDM